MKIAVIGGGSLLWTTGFVRQFVNSRYLKNTDLTLMDIDPKALKLTTAVANTYNQRHGSPVIIAHTLDTDTALDGADFVIVSISTGGLETMRPDLEIPETYGILHTVGDTVGPGGWSRAIRNIPVFEHLAERMKTLCPKAWMINVSNPLTPLTRTPTKTHGIKCIGMCPGVEGVARSLSILAGAPENADRGFVSTGVDHASFILSLHVGGMDVLAELKRKGFCRSDDRLMESVDTNDPYIKGSHLRAVFAIWRELGYMPGISDRHMVENFPNFLTGANPDGELPFGLRRTSIEDRRKNYAAARQSLEKYLADPTDENLGALGHGDDPIVKVVESLCGHSSFVWGANYRNVGQVPSAPADAVVETRCLFNSDGVRPAPSPMPDTANMVVLPIIHRQEAIVDIALHGTFDELAALVTTDPLCARLPFGACRKMMRELVTANQKYIRNRRLLEF